MFVCLVVYTLTTPFSDSDYIGPNEGVIAESRNGKDVVGSGRGLIIRYYPGVCLEGLKKTTKSLSQDSRSLGRDLKPGPPEYEAQMLNTRPRSSVLLYDIKQWRTCFGLAYQSSGLLIFSANHTMFKNMPCVKISWFKQ
jgi:hypothetical protein